MTPKFLTNQLLQDVVIRNFEVEGEACNNIEKHYLRLRGLSIRQLPLSFAYQVRECDMRDSSFKVDFEIVWKTCPAIFQACTRR